MTSFNRRESIILLIGDILAFYVALWLMLLVRYGRLPESDIWALHFASFSVLFIVWIAIFFIAGLYEKHTNVFKSRVGTVIWNAQIANSIIASIFFYIIPYFGITPKTNLFIDLVFSFALIVLWRIYLFPALAVRKKEKAILIGSGTEMSELMAEVNNNPRYGLHFIAAIDLDTMAHVDFQKEVLDRMRAEDAYILATDFRSEKVAPFLPSLYSLLFSTVKFIDINKLYEDIFDRVPLSLIQHNWFLENIAGSTRRDFDLIKRGMDIILTAVLGTISLVLYPFVFVAVKMEDGGPIFFHQERVGKNGEVVTVVKFRSLEVHNDGQVANDPRPTKVGTFLRKTRIDELPQLWNVLLGDLSLIGPRPEIPALVKLYAKEIPYYNIRHLVKPGLSGWAQLYGEHGHGAAAVDETRNKLSYDLYYIKNRSFILDLKIALRTIKTLLSREGV